MLDYAELQEEIEFVKEKSSMADTLMNFNNLQNGDFQDHRVPHDQMDGAAQLEISYQNNDGTEVLRKKKINEHIDYFISNSTLHGFHFCFDKKHKVRRIIWMMLVTASIGLLLEKLHESTLKFFTYPFSTTTTINYVDHIKFPAISICNINDYRMSKMKGTKLYKIMKQPGGLGNKANRDNISGTEYAETIKMASHKKSDMIYSCTALMLNKTCYPHNFSTFYQTQGETCHRLNSDGLITVDKPGASKAVDLIINIEQYEYMGSLDSGIRLIIHDQEETPVQMQGLALSPGFTTHVSIMKKMTTNLRKPYDTDCGERKLKYFQHYSQNTCYIQRLTDYVEQHCNCKDGFMPGPAEVCSLNELAECAWPRWDKFKKIKDIDCPIACEVTAFEPLLSFAQFPSNNFADEIAQNLNLTGSPQENRRFIRDNFVRVLVYFEHMSYTHMVQTPSYDLMVLLGDIGGQLGLFLGTSMLTYIEFFDVVAMIIYTKFFEIFKPK